MYAATAATVFLKGTWGPRVDVLGSWAVRGETSQRTAILYGRYESKGPEAASKSTSQPRQNRPRTTNRDRDGRASG